MSVLRRQFIRQVAVSTAASPSVTTVDILGPESTSETPYAEGTDYLTRPRQALQNNAGNVVIDGWDGTALSTANVNVTVEIWSRSAIPAGRNLQTPLYPTGSPLASNPVLKRVVATGVLGNSRALIAALGGKFEAAAADKRDRPLLDLRADEFVRLTITATAGGALGPVTLSAKYDFGQSQSQV